MVCQCNASEEHLSDVKPDSAVDFPYVQFTPLVSEKSRQWIEIETTTHTYSTVVVFYHKVWYMLTYPSAYCTSCGWLWPVACGWVLCHTVICVSIFCTGGRKKYWASSPRLLDHDLQNILVENWILQSLYLASIYIHWTHCMRANLGCSFFFWAKPRLLVWQPLA